MRKNPFIEVVITEDIKTKAQRDKYGYKDCEKQMKTSKLWAQKYTHFIGDIGELLIQDYLDGHDVRYEEDKIYANHGDYFDFKINKKTYDVKTRHMKSIHNLTQPDYWCLIPIHQIGKKVDYYISVLLSPELKTGYLMGFITSAKAKTYPVVSPSYLPSPAHAIPFSDLMDLSYIYEGHLITLDDWM